MKRCYFKRIVESDSKEGRSYQESFNLDLDRCRTKCTGYHDYGTCEHFIIDIDSLEGLEKLAELRK